MHLSGLYRYPLKSSAAEPLTTSSVGSMGLEGDRRWLVIDEASGRFLTQRLLGQMTQLTARYSASGALTLMAPGRGPLDVAVPPMDACLRGVIIWSDTLRAPDAGDAAAAWLSDFLQRPCRLVYMPDDCFRPVKSDVPSDRVSFADGFPLLLIGRDSLTDLSRRVGRPLELLRFRPNLVITGAEPYAEDYWRRIRIGSTVFRIAGPCSRCIITTLDPEDGTRSADREPLKTLKDFRQHEGKVYFGQNLIPDSAGHLEVGMPVELLE
jgi:uncharacterized protein YcbX